MDFSLCDEVDVSRRVREVDPQQIERAKQHAVLVGTIDGDEPETIGVRLKLSAARVTWMQRALGLRSGRIRRVSLRRVAL